MENISLTKKIIAEERGLLLTTHTTFTTFTTSINNWGIVDIENAILLEAIAKNTFIYNIQGKIGVCKLKFYCKHCDTSLESEKNKISCICGKTLSFEHQEIRLTIDKKPYVFKLNKIHSPPIYLIPNLEEIQEILGNVNKSDDTLELFNEIETFLLTLFDFNNPIDSKVCALYILFSYILPYFDKIMNKLKEKN